MKTQAIEGSRLTETFLYVRADQGTATLVLLHEAKVVAVHTGSY